MSIESDLIKAFRHATDGERRFGLRDDCKEDMEARWLVVIDLLKQLKKCGKKLPV